MTAVAAPARPNGLRTLVRFLLRLAGALLLLVGMAYAIFFAGFIGTVAGCGVTPNGALPTWTGTAKAICDQSDGMNVVSLLVWLAPLPLLPLAQLSYWLRWGTATGLLAAATVVPGLVTLIVLRATS